MCVFVQPNIGTARHLFFKIETSSFFSDKKTSRILVLLFRDGTGSPGQRFWPGQVGGDGSVSDQVFVPVLSFNMRVYRGVVCTE